MVKLQLFSGTTLAVLFVSSQLFAQEEALVVDQSSNEDASSQEKPPSMQEPLDSEKNRPATSDAEEPNEKAGDLPSEAEAEELKETAEELPRTAAEDPDESDEDNGSHAELVIDAPRPSEEEDGEFPQVFAFAEEGKDSQRWLLVGGFVGYSHRPSGSQKIRYEPTMAYGGFFASTGASLARSEDLLSVGKNSCEGGARCL